MMQKHDLIHEFPSYRDKINELKTGSNRFRKLNDEYEDINSQIFRIEEGQNPTTDEHLNELRLKRVHLKDSLYQMLLH